MFRLIVTPFAALMRLLRSSAQSHPAVFTFAPTRDAHSAYRADRAL